MKMGKQERIEAMLFNGVKPHNDMWRPSKKLQEEMEEKGFYIDYDDCEGYWRGCLYAPDGYRFTDADAHCDCSIKLSARAIRKAMDNIEECHCEECQEYWKNQEIPK